MNVPRACGAVLGLTLLVIPLLRHLTFEERLAEAKTTAAALAAVKGVTGGLFCGFAGLMVLWFVCDAGKGWGVGRCMWSCCSRGWRGAFCIPQAGCSGSRWGSMAARASAASGVPGEPGRRVAGSHEDEESAEMVLTGQ